MSHLPIPPSPQQLDLLSTVLRELTRSRRMSVDDAQDFTQCVHLRFVERGFDIFQRFSGRSSLTTYLRVVVKRMLLDWQNHQYGKWRPTLMASRHGDHAVALDRLITRDRFSVDEAIAIVRMRANAPDEVELRRLAERLPRRHRRRTVLVDTIEPRAVMDFEDPVVTREHQRSADRIRALLARAVKQLPHGDRELIALRYRDRRTVRDVAATLQTDSKALYRRFDRLLRSLRTVLTEQGVTSSTTIDVH